MEIDAGEIEQNGDISKPVDKRQQKDLMNELKELKEWQDNNTEQLMLKCSEGHEMKLFRIGEELDENGQVTDYVCDACERVHVAGGEEAIWHCTSCGFDLCQTCAHKESKTQQTINELDI